jgi:hypothetical protein
VQAGWLLRMLARVVAITFVDAGGRKARGIE